jgi:uncharacterized protein (TIGR02598 family)
MERVLTSFRFPGAAGMSLVEVTLALGITSFAVIVIMALLATALGHNSDSSERALLAKIFRSATEAAKTAAETNNRSLPWQAEWAYTHEGVACGLADAQAHYRAHVSAQPSAAWPGAASSNAWTVRFEIANIPKKQVINTRTTFFVKEPPSVP